MKQLGFELWCVVLALLVSLTIGGLVLLYLGESPAQVYWQLLQGALGSKALLAETISATTPYLCCGLSLTIAFRAGLFNIGAEGQLFMGAMAAAIAGRYLAFPFVGMIGLVLVAFAVGMAWGLIPAWLKIRFGVHEVINTIMLNSIAFSICAYLLKLPSVRLNASTPQTADVAVAAQWKPLVIGGLSIDMGFVFAVCLAIILWHILRDMVVGFELCATGIQPEAAKTAGISINRTTLIAFGLSGGIAGLAGGLFVAVPGHPYFQMGFSPGWGYWGIALALLARNHPLAVIPAALLFGIMETGSGRLDAAMGIPRELVYVLEAIIILLLSARLFHRLLDPTGERHHV